MQLLVKRVKVEVGGTNKEFRVRADGQTRMEDVVVEGNEMFLFVVQDASGPRAAAPTPLEVERGSMGDAPRV